MPKEKIYTSCKRCGGSGIANPGGLSPVEDPCTECGGTGKVAGFDAIDLSSADDQAEVAIAALDVKVNALQTDVTKCLRRLKKIMDKLEIGDE